MNLEALIKLLGPVSRTFKDDAHWWSNVSKESMEQAKILVPSINVVSVFAYPDKVVGGQKYDVCFSEGNLQAFLLSKSKKDLISSLLEFIHAFPGSNSEQITVALKDAFPSAHFDTFLEVHASRHEFCRVNFLVAKTETSSQCLLTLYFPRGTTLGL